MIKKILKNSKYDILALLFLMLVSTAIMKSDVYNCILDFDIKVIDLISKIISNHLTTFFIITTEFGNVFIPIGIIIVLFIFYKNKYISILQSLSYCFAGFISILSKLLVYRDRPVKAIIDLPITSSFPSGHSLTSFVFYFTLCYLLTKNKSKKIKIISYIMVSILVLLVGISRIYLGVHYFSDVIGGFIYGAVIFVLIRNIFESNFKDRI